VALAVIGIDQLSSITDRFGPLAADQAVREVAAAVRRAIRDVDHLFLYSAGEFVLVLDPGDQEGPPDVARRVRAEVEALGLPNPASTAGLVTVSVGTVDLDMPATSVELEAAIARTRRQMHDGRNAAPRADSAGASGQRAEEPVTR
jgi:diguanylate cyclase (GGDEF)-like protein